MEAKKYNKIVLAGTALLLVACVLVIVVADPYFHYHKPLGRIAYVLENQRYQNHGIMKNFEYNAVITGSSVTENFKTSEADALFGAKFIKVPFAGAYYKEVSENLETAFESGNEVRMVIRSLEPSMLIEPKDRQVFSEEELPIYLYDKNPWNDVAYVLNKEVACLAWDVLRNTMRGKRAATFDEYSGWHDDAGFGRDFVRRTYVRPAMRENTVVLDAKMEAMVRENVKQNVTAIVQAHPETEFYLFWPPFSVAWWDEVAREGRLDCVLDAQLIAMEEILQCENVRLFGFSNNYEMVCNLDNYKDKVHYGSWINTEILHWMHGNEYRLTKENYRIYIEELRKFYHGYDYEWIYE